VTFPGYVNDGAAVRRLGDGRSIESDDLLVFSIS
jgi:hypothetical protein